MAWVKKTKIATGGVRSRILTPDLNRILVGSSEDLVLIFQIDFTDWSLKSKNAEASATLKTKIQP